MHPKQPSTYFAPAEKAGPAELRDTITYVSKNPVINGVLKCTGGLIAVLNKERQILSVNQSFLDGH